jgi:hypothetical protein
MVYRVVLNSPNTGPVFLGNYSEVEVSHLCESFSDEGIALSINNYSEKRRLAANPAEFGDTEQDVAKRSIESPIKDFKRQLLSSETTVGKKRKIKYPIKKDDFMRYSLEEAALNLAILIPTARKHLPDSFVKELEKKRHISQEFIDNYPHPQTLKEIVLEVVDQLLKTNTKMEKSKAPSALGIGKPSDLKGFNEVFLEGAKGLMFLPNITLIAEQKFSSGERSKDSFLTVIENTLLEEDLSGIKSSNTLFRDICTETLRPLKNRKLTACTRASEECIVPCLVDSGKRYSGGGIVDIYRQPETEKKYATRYGRMVLGCRQTAFLANPYYFFRILTQSVLARVATYEANLCIINDKTLGNEEKVDISLYRKFIPPSVRLNTYSDYMWESICPAFFDLFNGKTKGYPYVQFYDYTKIPGRWSSEQRALVKDHFKMDYTADKNYRLPENYHITFSFAGTPTSAQDSNLAAHVGQNSTVVYFTSNIAGETLKNVLKKASTQNESDWNEEINGQISDLRRRIKTALKREGFKVSNLKTGRGDVLPERKQMSSRDFKVINGDAYDLRFLDEHLKDDPNQSLIVGLSWKAPTSIKVGVEGSPEFTLNPFTAAAFNSYTKTAKFAELRLNLGLDTEISNLDTTVELFISPVENHAESIRELFRGIANIPQDQLDYFTFSTESGQPLNSYKDPAFVKDFIEEAIREFIYSFTQS